MLLLWAVGLLLAGALASLALARRRQASGWVAVAFVGTSAVLLWAVAVRSFTAPAAEQVLLRLAPLNAALAIRVDGLSAVFLAVVATIGFLATLYSVEFLRSYPDDTVAKYYPVLQVLLAGIVGVLVTADFLFFLVFWELMTLASFFLVTFERENAEAQRAGLKYFVVNQAAALGMLAAALLLWHEAGSFHMDAFRAALGGLLRTDPLRAHLVLLLFTVGFATKAGVLPFGSWLPDAYPAAPTSATAAFGGTMTKLGIYGILRVYLHLLPLSSATTAWGVALALGGLLTLFVGTLTALQQEDAKRLMAFHTVGQTGYMLLGIGIGLALLRTDPALAAIALLGGFLHTVNNALYKSCLFLTAGAIEHRTGTRSLGAMGGGLGALMPGTALAAFIASLSIAGVPPFNGFASKWLMYAGGILGSRTFSLLAAAVLVAMFISLATLASFLKYFGGAFLGAVDRTRNVREVPLSMLVPQLVLAALCLAIGLVPMLPLRYLDLALLALPTAATLPTLDVLFGTGSSLAVTAPAGVVASWAPLVAGGGILVLALLAWFALQRAGAAERREVPVWLCGETETAERVRYAPGSFYRPFKHAFHNVYPTFHPAVPAFPRVLRRILEPDGWLYLPVARGTEAAARRVSHAHVGVLQVYLLWIIVGAVAVVALVLLLGGGAP